MQAFHCIFGVGCLVAPLIAQPFLLQASDPHLQSTTTTLKPDVASVSNAHHSDGDGDGVGVTVWEASRELNATMMQEGESQLKYAYLIAGLLMLLSCCGMACVFLMGDRRLRLRKHQKSESQLSSLQERQGIMDKQRIIYLAILSVLALFFLVYVALEAAYCTYMLTFVVKYLGWSKTMGAAVTSALMGAFTGGRALGIILVTVIRPFILLMVDLVVCVIFSVILVVFVDMHVSIFWICSVGLGLGMATVYATGFTWTESYIGVSAKVSALILVASSFGEMIGPAITGPLMEKVSLMSYAYITLSLVVSCLACMIVMELLGRKLKKLMTAKSIESAKEVGVTEDEQQLRNHRDPGKEVTCL